MEIMSPFRTAAFLDYQIFFRSQTLMQILQIKSIFYYQYLDSKFKKQNIVNTGQLGIFIDFDYKLKMNINSMQFISHRDSIASSFAQQTQKSSSMLSSRRKLLEEEAENDLEDFKQQIQYKFIRSVSNKTYTYPLSQEGFDIFDDEEQFSDLVGVKQYNLFDQGNTNNPDRFKKQQFKIKNPKITSKSATLLLEALRTERQRIANLRNYINETNETKKDSKNAGVFYTDGPEQSNRQLRYEQNPANHNYRKKRLNTEPYEKPVGFVIKKGDKYVK